MVDELETKESENTGTEGQDDKTLVPIAELRKVRHEAEKHRKELLEYKEKIKSQEEAVRLVGLDEISKAQELLKKAEADNKNLRESMNRVQIESAIMSFASTLEFTDPQDAVKLVNLSEAQDDKGNVDVGKIEIAVKKVAEDKPYLRSGFNRSSFGGPTNPIPPGGPKPKFNNENDIAAIKLRATELTRQGRIIEGTKLYNLAWEHQQKLIK